MFDIYNLRLYSEYCISGDNSYFFTSVGQKVYLIVRCIIYEDNDHDINAFVLYFCNVHLLYKFLQGQ